jgi:hypothetical protein
MNRLEKDKAGGTRRPPWIRLFYPNPEVEALSVFGVDSFPIAYNIRTENLYPNTGCFGW